MTAPTLISYMIKHTHTHTRHTPHALASTLTNSQTHLHGEVASIDVVVLKEKGRGLFIFATDFWLLV